MDKVLLTRLLQKYGIQIQLQKHREQKRRQTHADQPVD